MYCIYFYDKDKNVIDNENYEYKTHALESYNFYIDRFSCPYFYGKRKGKKVKTIEICENGIPLDYYHVEVKK